MIPPTVKQFEAWCDEHVRAAETVLLARAFALTERARVDAYTRPIFESFGFCDEDGDPITHPDRLYHCPDDARCRDYYDACARAHREHGWTGDPEHCPALVAEDLQRQAENALLDASEPLGLGLSVNRSLELRERALELLLSACMSRPGAAKSAADILDRKAG